MPGTQYFYTCANKKGCLMGGNDKQLMARNIVNLYGIRCLGWGDLFKFKTARGTVTSVGSATPAILMVLVAFGLPSKLQFWPFQVETIF